MSTRELAYSILEKFTDEQLIGFILLFKDIVPNDDLLNAKTEAILNDIRNGFNK